jgi:hypothetical protein
LNESPMSSTHKMCQNKQINKNKDEEEGRRERNLCHFNKLLGPWQNEFYASCHVTIHVVLM